MPRDRKYGNVSTDVVAFNESDEPVFIIRAQDAASVSALYAYALMALNKGASPSFAEDVTASAKRFADWQARNLLKVKVPD